MDLVVTTSRLPKAGETVFGDSFFTAPGGKGANQAVAAARLGASTTMIGRVGRDPFGETLLRSLEADGVDASAVIVDSDVETGTALISLANDGANSIVVVPGANGRVGNEELAVLERLLPEAKALLLQLEVSLEIVTAAAQLAVSAGVTVILDPAPARRLPESLLSVCTWVTPNETEAETLCGFTLTDEQSTKRAADFLLAGGAQNVVITLGARGCLLATAEKTLLVSAPRVDAVDTVAAGDAFNGALAAALVENHSVEESLRWACAAGSLAATVKGAQPSLPSRPRLEQILSAQGG